MALNLNFHINVRREAEFTRVAVADQDGEVIDVKEFIDRPDGLGSREFRALAWTMGVLLHRSAPEQGMRWNQKKQEGPRTPPPSIG